MIIAVYGSKQREAADELFGFGMKHFGIVDNFRVEDGLEVEADIIDENSQVINKEFRPFNHRNEHNDLEFASWACSGLWPWVKSYSLRRPTVEAARNLFGFDNSDCFRDDPVPTNILWEYLQFMPDVPFAEGNLNFDEVVGMLANFADNANPDGYIFNTLPDRDWETITVVKTK
jgi:hypothetical protein